MRIPEEGTEQNAEKIFEETMAPNFPNLMKGMNLHIQAAQQIPSRVHTKRYTFKRQKQRILRAVGEK